MKAFLLIVAAACCGRDGLGGQDAQQATASAAASDREQFRRWQAHYAQWASRHEFHEAGANPSKLTFHSRPVHVYANPAGGAQSHGAIFLWTKDNRPAVIGAMWTRQIRTVRYVTASVHSTSPEPLRGARDGQTYWTPREAGVELKEWCAAKPPANSRYQRLMQMRNIVREIEAVRIHQGDETILRTLSQPLFRYQNDDVVDGAVFGMFYEWDPEIFAIVEARVQDGGSRWVVGFARFSNKGLRVTHAGKAVWSFDPSGPEPPLGGKEFPYFSVLIERRPATIGNH
jgi:hypothetical protein